MRVLLDTNIILDLLLKRDPWFSEAKALFDAHAEGKLAAHISASMLTDVFYIVGRLLGREQARVAVQTCLSAFEVCAVDREALEAAIALPGADFEDNLQLVCANRSNLAAIVTRDKDGFAGADMPVLSPAEMIMRLARQ